MLETLKKLVKKDDDLPERAYTLEWREQFRTSKIYDNLDREFHEESTGPRKSEYVPLCQRKPSVRFGLPKIIVNDSTALVFSEGHFPGIDIADEIDGNNKIEQAITDLIKETSLREIMLDAAVRGSIGSIAIAFRVLKGRVFWKVMPTRFLTPEWKADEPDALLKVTEKYKVKGRALRDRGYAIPEDKLDEEWWFKREWTEVSELWYKPWPVKREEPGDVAKYPEGDIDTTSGRTTHHHLGFVPIEWIKNLPGGDNDVDGAPTVVDEALCNSIEIDYQLSQGGRGLKYASDPTLVLKEAGIDMGNSGEPIVRSAGNALMLGPTDDAKLLEINGTASAAVLAYVDKLRELSLELCGGSRASPEKLSAAQSGRAMELMNQNLIWLADKLRTSYGERALVNLLKMVIRANAKAELKIAGETYAAGRLGDPAKAKIALKWPPWYPPTMADLAQLAAAIDIFMKGGVIGQKTAVKQVAGDFDIEDVDEEIKQINKEADERSQREADAAAKIAAAKPTLPRAA